MGAFTSLPKKEPRDILHERYINVNKLLTADENSCQPSQSGHGRDAGEASPALDRDTGDLRLHADLQGPSA